jgi:hypothetical protein
MAKMGRPRGSKNKARVAVEALATLRTRRGPNRPRELPFCTGQHCPHCGRAVVPAQALPYWYTPPQPYSFMSSNTGPQYAPPPIVSHGNGTTLDVFPPLKHA